MYEIDPTRVDLAREFRSNPAGPYSPELTQLVNCLRTMPFADRHVIVCTKRGEAWIRFSVITTMRFGKCSNGAGKR